MEYGRGTPLLERALPPRPAGRIATTLAVACLLTATAAFRCPGPEPSAAPTGSGGGDGPGGASGSSVATVTSTGGGEVASSSGGEAGGGGDVSSIGSAGSGGTGGSGATGGGGEGGEGGGGDCGDTDSDPDSCGACDRQCSGQGVVQRSCVEGECAPLCDATHVDIGTPPVDSEDDGCELEGRRVFVTSTSYTAADLGSVEGADVICEGVSANLGGLWKAWISSLQPVTASPAEDFSQPAVPYRLLDGTIVADGWDALIAGPLDNPIDMDESETPDVDVAVWTGTAPDGSPTAADCFGWSSVGTDAADTGSSSAIGSTWTVDVEAFCIAAAHLYCFEQ